MYQQTYMQGKTKLKANKFNFLFQYFHTISIHVNNFCKLKKCWLSDHTFAEKRINLFWKTILFANSLPTHDAQFYPIFFKTSAIFQTYIVHTNLAYISSAKRKCLNNESFQKKIKQWPKDSILLLQFLISIDYCNKLQCPKTFIGYIIKRNHLEYCYCC